MRAAPSEVCRLGGIYPSETIKVAMSAGADASTEREVRSIEMDILNGSLPPDSRLRALSKPRRVVVSDQRRCVARFFVVACPTRPQARSASGPFAQVGVAVLRRGARRRSV
jgi:hypothetical protein